MTFSIILEMQLNNAIRSVIQRKCEKRIINASLALIAPMTIESSLVEATKCKVLKTR